MSKIALLALGAVFLGSPAYPGTNSSKKIELPLALVNVSIVDVVTGQTSSNKTILIRNGRIGSILPSKASLPPGVERLDCHGGYAVPGLWDSHVHLTDATLTDAAAAAPYFIRAGVTSVRDMGGNLPVIDTLRALEKNDVIVGPHIIRAGPFIDGPKEGASDRIAVESPLQAASAIQALREERVDFIKIHNGVTRETFLAVVAAARDAGLRVATHLPHSISAEDAVESGVSTLEHTETLLESGLRSLNLTGKSAEEGQEALVYESRTQPGSLIARMKTRGTCFTPTLSEYRSFGGLPAEGYSEDVPKFAPPSLLAFWEKFFAPEPPDATWKSKLRQQIFSHFFDLVRAMSQSGVPIMAGTDFGARDIYPGASLHEELYLLSKAGMSNLDVLRSATLNPAKCMGLSNDYGSIAAGKVADVVIVNENPLLVVATLGHPSRIIHDGVVFTDAK